MDLSIRNGFHIPFMGSLVYIFSQSTFSTVAISLKLFQENYYYWYHPHFKAPSGIPSWANYFKQFSHFTDTGHIISLLALYDTAWVPIAFNVHFVITVAYWSIIFLFNESDDDEGDFSSLLPHQRPWEKWTEMWWTMNHSLPLLVIGYSIWMGLENLFTMNTLVWSMYWFYGWVVFVYVPWRLIMNDAVYSILRWGTPIWKILVVFVMIHVLFITGNCIGIVISQSSS
jgi:hypothetical protein